VQRGTHRTSQVPCASWGFRPPARIHVSFVLD
jgi:hypothetical protein